jgi:hypothetical protein
MRNFQFVKHLQNCAEAIAMRGMRIEESPNITEQGAEQGRASALRKFRRAGAILARQRAQQKANRLAHKAG